MHLVEGRKTVSKTVAALLLGGVLAAGWGCGRSAAPVQTAVSGRDAAPPQTAIVAPVRRDSLAQELVVAAEFHPYQEVEVHAKVPGFVRTISVDIGDRVRAGQVLATLEVPELQDDVSRAEASKGRYRQEIIRAQSEIRRYKAGFEEADTTFRRLEAVNRAKPNLVAQQEIDVARSQKEVAAAQVESAEASLAAAKQQLTEAESLEKRARTLNGYGRIVAPFAGVVTKRFVDLGTMVQAGTASNVQALPVVRISQVDTLRLTFPVPESAIPQVRRGSEVSIRVPTLGKTLTGKVVRTSGHADSATRTMETQVDVANPNFELKPGMLASVVITLEHHGNVLAVPIQAVSDPGGTASVLVVRPDNTVEARTVRVGIETASDYEITAGLKEGERVIVVGRDRFTAGQTVEPRLSSATPPA